MKIRRSIIWFVLVVAALIALVLWYGKKQPTEMLPTASVETNMPPTATAKSPAMASASVPTSPSITQATPSQPVPTPPMESKGQQMREGLAKLNDEDVVFYGKVLDQFGLPVPGANVAGTIQVNNGIRVGADKITVVTDENGFFKISGYTGKALGIWVTKNGYVLATANTRFVYSLLWPESQRYTPDQDNPTVIKMWKLQGAEPLVGISKEYRLPFTGAPIYFDLVSGKIVPTGGDLEAVITRASGSISQRHHGDWTLEFRPIGGGIIESDYHTAQITFEAPDDGYQDNYVVEMRQDQPHWSDSLRKVFFLKSRDGAVYSRLNFDFRINDEPNGLMWFQFRGVANTNGSRNWEATAPQ